MMKWEKLGLVFCPDNNFDWMKTHSANPVAQHLYDDYFRIYFSCRNENNQASIGYVDININEPSKILNLSQKPVLTPGEIGTFDDSGVSMGWLLQHNENTQYLYYLGWNLGVTVPWRNSIGLAISKNGQPFDRYSQAPVVDRNAIDPFSISYPCVLKDTTNYKMWYGSNLKWGKNQEDMAHLLKYAESSDGINWERKNHIAIHFKNESEYAMSKPCVIKESDKLYKMWFSYRGKSYRIGYAESENGIDWIRQDDKVGIDVSADGWDSDSIEYPNVFKHNNQYYMLYNGNKYGLTGFGIAQLI